MGSKRSAGTAEAVVLREDVWDGVACADCVVVIANRDYSGFDSGERLGEVLAGVSAAGDVWVSCGGHGEGGCECTDCEMCGCEHFSSSPCDVCGTTLAGERHAVRGVVSSVWSRSASGLRGLRWERLGERFEREGWARVPGCMAWWAVESDGVVVVVGIYGGRVHVDAYVTAGGSVVNIVTSSGEASSVRAVFDVLDAVADSI